MAVNTNIAGQIQPPQFADPLQQAGQAMQLQHLVNQDRMAQVQFADAQRKQTEQRSLADLYRTNLNPNGMPNDAGIVRGMAEQGLGHMVPGYIKDSAENTSKLTKAQTDQFKLQKDKLDYLGGAVSSLLSDPNTNHDKVIQTVVQLAQSQIIPMEMAAQFVRTLPSDPAQLRQMLLEKGLEAMDHSKRIEQLLPKHNTQDTGAQLVERTINPLTGIATPTGVVAEKQVTPDTAANNTTSRANNRDTNATSIRNNELDAAVSREGQAITKTNGASVVLATPTGVNVIDKTTALATPVTTTGGVPVIPKDSQIWKDAQKSAKLTATIADARKLIPIATASGAGALYDKGAGFFGVSPPGADAAAQLETLAGWMTSNVPRMEGPQSDADTKLYAKMAAQVGDKTVPASQRLASLTTLEGLQRKYQHLNKDAQDAGTNPPQPAGGSEDGAGRRDIINSPVPVPIPKAGARPPLDAFKR